MQIKDLTKIAKAFREAFETIGRSYGFGFFPSFPEGCCTWASIFVGNFLIEEYGLCPLRTHSDSLHSGISHEWVLLEGIIIDITADQFDDSAGSVIVKKESAWHKKLKVSEISYYSQVSKYDNPHEPHKVSDIYKSIKSRVLKSLK